MKTHQIVIPRGKPIRAIHSDFTAAALAKLGSTVVDRASHVETWLSLTEEAKSWLVLHREVEEDPAGGSMRLVRPTVLGQYSGMSFDSLFWVDAMPCGLNVVYGPFISREDALQFEHDLLEVHGIPLTPQLEKLCHGVSPQVITAYGDDSHALVEITAGGSDEAQG